MKYILESKFSFLWNDNIILDMLMLLLQILWIPNGVSPIMVGNIQLYGLWFINHNWVCTITIESNKFALNEFTL